MISAATIAALEERRLEYILGARERSEALVKTIVMENDDPWLPLLIERQSGETQLFAKQLTIEEQRYIVCRNEKEAEKDRKDREAIVAALDAQLRKGDKAVGNWACRHETKDERTFKLQKSGVQVGFGTTVKPGNLEVLDIPRLATAGRLMKFAVNSISLRLGQAP